MQSYFYDWVMRLLLELQATIVLYTHTALTFQQLHLLRIYYTSKSE